jgi:hypothetical protein
MNARTLLRIGALLLTPLGIGAAEPDTRGITPPGVATAASAPAPGAFDLKNAAVQSLLRTTAVSATQSAPLPDASEARHENLAELRFRGPRRPQYMECDSRDCTAFTKDHDPLYTLSREQMRDQGSFTEGNSFDQWLSCQQGNDLLSTFERFDKCRGITIGLPPLQFRDVEIRLPPVAL